MVHYSRSDMMYELAFNFPIRFISLVYWMYDEDFLAITLDRYDSGFTLSVFRFEIRINWGEE